MTLVVTVGGATSNSYLSLIEADAYASQGDLGRQADRWLTAGPADKEKALIRATREVSVYLGDIGGTPWSATQALLFPRATDVDASAVPFLLTMVKLATYHQAVYLLENAELLDDASSRRARGLFSYQNPDGTGGSVALDPAFGRMAPAVEAIDLSALRRGTKIGSIRVRSSVRQTGTRWWERDVSWYGGTPPWS